MHNQIAELAAAALAAAPREGNNPQPYRGLHISRHSSVTRPVTCMSLPSIALVLQGRKTARLGGRRFELSAGVCITGALSVPDSYQIVQASPAEPFLGIVLQIDRARLAELAERVPGQAQPPAPPFEVMQADEALVGAFARLLACQASPADVAVLAPLAEQEILYRVLTGPAGRALRNLTLANTPEHRVGQAIAWLSEHFREPVSIDGLAARVHLGSSTFYRHFKAITDLSPLQYHKQLRLYEARRLMVENGLDATAAALTVGYESPNQFSREYKRLFGLPPRRHAKSAGTLAQQAA